MHVGEAEERPAALLAVRHRDHPGALHEPVLVLLRHLPGPAAKLPRPALSCGPSCSWSRSVRFLETALFGPPPLSSLSSPEEIFMAKALHGYLGGSDPRVTARLARENQILRQRVADLEAVTLRLQMENDTLGAMVGAADEVLEPA